MGFQVKYEEITSIRELILAQLDRWIEQIDAVRSSIVEIAAMSEMHGEAAEHVRSYMWDYHMNLANMIKDTIETYRSSFILYTDWYYNIDSDQLAEMSQNSMEGLEENIQGARSDFDAVAQEVADIERELSAYLDVGRFSTTCMESCFDNALAGVQNVRTQIGEYEEAHSHADMYPIDMMIGYLRSIIGGQLGGSSATISAYDASVVNATEPFQLAQMMDGMLSTYLEQVKDRVNSCEEFYATAATAVAGIYPAENRRRHCENTCRSRNHDSGRNACRSNLWYGTSTGDNRWSCSNWIRHNCIWLCECYRR